MSGLRLHSLRVENFKRIVFADINFDGRNLVQITGKNGAGKSSLIDSIESNMCGAKSVPDRPIREGSERANVITDFGDVVVEKTYEGNNVNFQVRTTRKGSKQEILTQLWNRMSVAPMEFVGRDTKAQATTLRQLAGLDFTKDDAERADVFSKRTAVNARAKSQEGRLAAMPYHEDAPAEEPMLADVLKEQKEAYNKQIENDRIRNDFKREKNDLVRSQADVNRAKERVDDLKRQLSSAEELLVGVLAEERDCEARVEIARLRINSLVDPDMTAIQERVTATDDIARKVRANLARSAMEAELTATKKEAEGLTLKLRNIDDAKKKRLTSAKYPIPGLGIDGDTVTFNGLPLVQASQSQRFRVAVAIAASLAPELRLILVRDTPMLDDDTIRDLDEWAESNDVQILMERVADPSEEIGIVIEDGCVRGATSTFVQENTNV